MVCNEAERLVRVGGMCVCVGITDLQSMYCWSWMKSIGLSSLSSDSPGPDITPEPLNNTERVKEKGWREENPQMKAISIFSF